MHLHWQARFTRICPGERNFSVMNVYATIFTKVVFGNFIIKSVKANIAGVSFNFEDFFRNDLGRHDGIFARTNRTGAAQSFFNFFAVVLKFYSTAVTVTGIVMGHRIYLNKNLF
jgi:hypothetical protein